ncbi:MAG: hypothetical protein ACRDJO_08385 [Actinomycetota bacterium]
MYVMFTARNAICLPQGEGDEAHVEVMIETEFAEGRVHFLIAPDGARDLAQRLVETADDIEEDVRAGLVRAAEARGEAGYDDELAHPVG